MEKRGISPLIATVLLIGFTIVLAAAIFQWGGSLVEKLKAQSEEKALTKITCVSDVNIDIKQACNLISSALITIDNKGNIDVKGLTVRLIGDKTYVQKVEEGISPFGAKKISVNMPYDITNLKQVEVFPRILVDGKEQTCESEIRNIDEGCGITLPNINMVADWTPSAGSLILVSAPAVISFFISNNLSVNEYNLNGLALENGGTITSVEFEIPAGFSGVVFDSWVKGNYIFELIDSADKVLVTKPGSVTEGAISYQGLIHLDGAETVKLKVYGSEFISISQLGLYQYQ